MARRIVRGSQDAHAVELAAGEQQLEEARELVGGRHDIAGRHDAGQEARVVGADGDLIRRKAERALEHGGQRRQRPRAGGVAQGDTLTSLGLTP